MPMGIVPEACALATITIGRSYSPFGGIAILLALVAFIAICMGLMWLAVMLGFVPDAMRPAGAERERPAHESRCRNCGYDLRASPERCPECGTVRPVTRPRADAAPPPSRMLWSVHFQAGEDVLDILVWRELMPTVDAVYDKQPAEADLLFAATGTDGDAIIASGDLRRAAQGILDLIDSRRNGFALGDVVATAARRARQFARQHPYARFQRTVTRRAT